MAARGVQGLIAVTALMGLAACGSVSAGSAGHPASASASSSKAPAAAAANAGRRVALRGRPERGPGRGQPDRVGARGHAQGRDPGTGHGRRAVRASARTGRAALRGRVRGIGPAGVRGRTAELPAGHRAGVGLPQRDRDGGDPVVVRVLAVRRAARRGGGRPRPAGAWHPPEQRAARVVTGLRIARAPGRRGRPPGSTNRGYRSSRDERLSPARPGRDSSCPRC